MRRRARRAADMARFASMGGGLMPMPSRDFVPAADSLFAPPKSKQKALPCETGPAGCPAMLEAQGSRRTHFATLRSDNRAKSAVEARFARALGFCASRRFRRGGSQAANSRKPSPEFGWRMYFCMPPFSPAEQRKALRACAQRTSRTDSARLFDRSVAKGVPRGPSRTEQRRAPRRGGAVRGELFAYFLAAQKVSRPPGRNPGMGLTTNTTATEAIQCL